MVVDASVALAWLMPDERSDALADILVHAGERPPLVPGLWLYEVANALLVAVRRRRLSREAAEVALDLLASVPVSVVQLGWLETRSAYRIAHAHGLSVHDAAYLQLAKSHETPLMTLDANLKKAARQLKIELYD